MSNPIKDGTTTGKLEQLSDVNAEAGLLSAMIRGKADKLIGNVEEDMFWDKQHRIMFKHINKMFMAGDKIDLYLLRSRIDTAGDMQAVGGIEYILQIERMFTSEPRAMVCFDIVREKCYARRIVKKIDTIGMDISTGKTSFEAAAELVSAMMDVYKSSKGNNIDDMESAIEKMMQDVDRRITGSNFSTKTGYGDLDKLILMDSGNLIILGGRPAMGKSTLALNIIYNNITRGVPVGLINYEMTTEGTMQRLASRASRTQIVNKTKKLGYVKDDESAAILDSVMKAASLLSKYPLFQKDKTTGSYSDLRSSIIAMVMVHGVRVVVIDYLQLVSPDRVTDNNSNDIGSMTKGLKSLAKELGIVIIALSQLNRSLENRKDKRPMLSDLRESGNIEQDADIVMFCHREEYYKENSKPGIMEVITAKNRNGATGIVELYYEKDIFLIGGMDNG